MPSALEHDTLVLAVFWEVGGGVYACGGAGVTSDSAGMVVVRYDASSGGVAVTVSHPYEFGGATSVTVAGHAVSGSGCAPDGQGGTVFTVAQPGVVDYMGASVTVSCGA